MMQPQRDSSIDNVKDLPEIARIYDALLQVTGKFLQQAKQAAPSEEDVAGFCERRAGLLISLHPLVDRQQRWLGQCDRAGLVDSVVQKIDAQLAQMQRLEALHAQLMECVAQRRDDLGRQLVEVRSGKKVLSGYGKMPKKAPRFCRGSV